MTTQISDVLVAVRRLDPLTARAARAEYRREETLDLVRTLVADRSPTRHRHRILRPVAAGLAVVALLSVPALALSGRLADIFSLSNRGASVDEGSLTGHEAFALSRLGTLVSVPAPDATLARGTPEIRLLAERDGRVFHVLHFARTGRRCYSTREAGDATRFGYVECPPSTFPSRAEPVLDMSLWREGTLEDGFTIARLEGFAADPVKAVALVAPDGTVHARTEVVDNVYSRGEAPRGSFAGILAFDAAGGRIELGCQARVGHACVARVGDAPRRSR